MRDVDVIPHVGALDWSSSYLLEWLATSVYGSSGLVAGDVDWMLILVAGVRGSIVAVARR